MREEVFAQKRPGGLVKVWRLTPYEGALGPVQYLGAGVLVMGGGQQIPFQFTIEAGSVAEAFAGYDAAAEKGGKEAEGWARGEIEKARHRIVAAGAAPPGNLRVNRDN
jgi:hypothetical protein